MVVKYSCICFSFCSEHSPDLKCRASSPTLLLSEFTVESPLKKKEHKQLTTSLQEGEYSCQSFTLASGFSNKLIVNSFRVGN